MNEVADLGRKHLLIWYDSPSLYHPTKEEQQAFMSRLIASEMRRTNPELFDIRKLIKEIEAAKQKEKNLRMVKRLKQGIKNRDESNI